MGMNDWPVVDRWWPQRNEWSRVKYGTFLLSLFLVLGALPYGLINRFSAWRGTTSLKVELPIDTELPFVAWMVIPYYSFYLYFRGQLGSVRRTDIANKASSFSNDSSFQRGLRSHVFLSSLSRLTSALKPWMRRVFSGG